jgi:hypothetical protein
MTADELRSAAKELYGDGWQQPLAEALGVNRSSITRYTNGSVPVPGPVAAAVRCFLMFKRSITPM